MTTRTESIIRLIDECSEDERATVLKHLRGKTPLHPLEAEWNTVAESLLTAIARSSDLTQRGIRGILAEATFADLVVPNIESEGWNSVQIEGHHPYDFRLLHGRREIRVQVKLQRKERGVPKHYAARSRSKLENAPDELYCVEVQRTRSGASEGQSTRPYHFGDFDILAVNLHPSTGDWRRFVYTPESWLLPRKFNSKLIEIFQPVPAIPDHYWTDDLLICMQRVLEKKRRKLYKR
jgi:hypothetical protein